LTKALELLVHQEICLLSVAKHGLELLVALLKSLNLEPLAFTGGLSGATIPENTLDAALLLLILGLGSLSRREVGLGLWEDLTP
jgi:hypothetical protein